MGRNKRIHYPLSKSVLPGPESRMGTRNIGALRILVGMSRTWMVEMKQKELELKQNDQLLARQMKQKELSLLELKQNDHLLAK